MYTHLPWGADLIFDLIFAFSQPAVRFSHISNRMWKPVGEFRKYASVSSSSRYANSLNGSTLAWSHYVVRVLKSAHHHHDVVQRSARHFVICSLTDMLFAKSFSPLTSQSPNPTDLFRARLGVLMTAKRPSVFLPYVERLGLSTAVVRWCHQRGCHSHTVPVAHTSTVPRAGVANGLPHTSRCSSSRCTVEIATAISASCELLVSHLTVRIST